MAPGENEFDTPAIASDIGMTILPWQMGEEGGSRLRDWIFYI